jgi:hypothetical protein
LITLANITVELMQYAVSELMTGETRTADQCLALVRQQAVLVRTDRAIETFATIQEKQEREEGAIEGLIQVDNDARRPRSAGRGP